MSGLLQNVKHNILGYLFTGDQGIFTSPSSIKLALIAYDPDTKTYSEVPELNTAYERQSVVFTFDNINTVSNDNVIVFPTATRRWGIIKRIQLYAYYDNKDPELIYEMDLSEEYVAESGSNTTFNPSSITITLE